MKKLLALLMVVFLTLGFVSCGKKATESVEKVSEKSWETVLKDAKGTTVNFYGWGGDDRTNKWIDTYLAKRLKDEYDITLKRVPMNIEDILNKMLGEKQAGKDKGTIDVVWINGENFYTAKTGNLLYGPFVDKLPNFNKYVDKNSIEVKNDFGFPTEGYEAPYGKAQFVFTYDENKTKMTFKNHQEILEFVKKNPGKFTYPAPPDFTGSAFVRNIIYDIVGYEQFMTMKPNKEVVKKEIQPAIDFLKKIKPYLWSEGKTYPSTSAQLNNMYADGQVFMTMGYNPYATIGKVASGEFPKNSKTFLLDKGTIGNTHFLAIPFNAPNKEGAMAVIDLILSPQSQASKYDYKNWGDLPVVDNSKLSTDEKKVFDNVKPGSGALPQDELLSHRVPEMPANLVPIIEEIWTQQVPKGE